MKPDYAKVKEYIKNTPDADVIAEYLGHEPANERETWQCVADAFSREYGFMVQRVGGQRAFCEWLQGLPGVVTFAFYNCDILTLARAWGSLATDAAERQEDKILENWWNFLSMNMQKEARRNGVRLF